MKPSDLYEREPESVNGNLYALRDHVPELSYIYNLPDDDSGVAQIKYYKDFCFDGRRIWRLASVWYLDRPFMIIQNAGREGDDHRARFVTDLHVYMQFVNYVKDISERPVDESTSDAVIDPNAEIPNLDSFYGSTLDGTFERYRY